MRSLTKIATFREQGHDEHYLSHLLQLLHTYPRSPFVATSPFCGKAGRSEVALEAEQRIFGECKCADEEVVMEEVHRMRKRALQAQLQQWPLERSMRQGKSSDLWQEQRK
jgi:hypothetical protein